MLEVDGIERNYLEHGKMVKALRPISFSVSYQEFVAIMGPSGVGKSTLLNIIGLLEKPTSGSYLFEQINVSSLSNGKRAKLRNRSIGFVFQNFQLLKTYTVFENVKVPLIYSGFSFRKHKEMVHKALEKVGMLQRANTYPYLLSGGEQQRIAIARAIVCEPPLLLADEPTGNLDAKSTGEIVSIFKNLQAQGSTILMVTHDSYVAEQADRIINISKC